MAITETIKGYDGDGWDIDFGASDSLALCGLDFGSGIPVGGFNDSTHKTDSAMSVDSCPSDHVRNTKYIDSTHVSLEGEASVELTVGNVVQTDCTLRFSFNDSSGNTALSDGLVYAYNGSDIDDAPVGAVWMAFEHDGSAIQKDRYGDAGGEGYAWNSNYGIGGHDNGLELTDQASASTHYFYIGLSVSPTSRGVKTGKIRIEWSVS